MWTTEAWMTYPPHGFTASFGRRPVQCQTVRVWWWNFPEKPASQNHWLCLGGIFRDGSRPWATCEMVDFDLRIDIYLQHFLSGLKVWCVKCPSDIIMQNKRTIFDSPELNNYRSMLYRVLQLKLQQKIVCQQVERRIVCQKVWMNVFWKTKMSTWSLGGLAVKLFSENFAKQQPVAEEGVSPWFLLSHGSQICVEKDIVARQRVKCGFNVMVDI